MQNIWLDLEFTGTSPKTHHIREMAFICGPYERYLKIGNGFTRFPGQVEIAFAAKTFLKNVIQKHAGEGGMPVLRFAGYNVNYDVLWLKRHMFPEFHDIWRVLDPVPLDVLAYARKAKKAGLLDVPNCTLETVAAHFGIPHTPHNALSDIRATRFVWKKLQNMKGKHNDTDSQKRNHNNE